MLKAQNGSFYDANPKGGILWEGTNHVFFGCLSGHFGSLQLFFILWKFSKILLEKHPITFLKPL